jgi:hypothetical protein
MSAEHKFAWALFMLGIGACIVTALLGLLLQKPLLVVIALVSAGLCFITGSYLLGWLSTLSGICTSLIIITGGLALLGWGVWPEPPVSRGFLQVFSIQVSPDHRSIEVGKQFDLSAFYGNPVDDRVFDASAYQAVFIAGANDQSEEMVKSSFEKLLKPIKAQYLSGRPYGVRRSVGHNSGIWGTKGTLPLTQADCQGILDGSLPVYFLSWFAWAKSENGGHKEFDADCRWLQPPVSGNSYTSSTLIWHFCQ